MSWGSDFWTYWTYSGTAYLLESSDLIRHIQPEKLTEPIVSPLKLGKWGGQSDIPFTHIIRVTKSIWVLPLLKLRSRYETDWMMVISCEGTSPSSCWKCLVTPVQLWCRRIPIRIVYWEHPSSCLGNLKCPSIYKDCESILTALRNKVEKSATKSERRVKPSFSSTQYASFPKLVDSQSQYEPTVPVVLCIAGGLNKLGCSSKDYPHSF